MRSVPRKLALALIFAGVAGCGPQAQKPTGPVVTGEGFAGVKFGMTVAQAEAALGHKLLTDNPDDVDDNGCRYYHPGKSFLGLSFMTADGVIVRLDVYDTKDIMTEAGAKIGDGEQHVLDLYKGRVRVEPHFYTGPEGHYVLVLGPDGKA